MLVVAVDASLRDGLAAGFVEHLDATQTRDNAAQLQGAAWWREDGEVWREVVCWDLTVSHGLGDLYDVFQEWG